MDLPWADASGALSIANKKAIAERSNWMSQQSKFMIILKPLRNWGSQYHFKYSYNRFKLCHPELVSWSYPLRHIMLLHDLGSGWSLFWVSWMLIIFYYILKKNPRVKLHKVSSLQAVTSAKEAKRDSNKGCCYAIPTHRDVQVQEGAHCAPSYMCKQSSVVPLFSTVLQNCKITQSRRALDEWLTKGKTGRDRTLISSPLLRFSSWTWTKPYHS